MSKTDARGITTGYSYDALNRLIGKTYSDGESAITYTYDQGTNGLGLRTGMTDAAGSEAWTYDPMGRIATDQRTTNGARKTMSYAYNLDGTLQSLTYPSGRVVNYQVSGAELPTSAADSTNTYASGATYAPNGALTAVALGQSITVNQSYSSRLQPSAIHAQAAGGTDLLDLAYDFGLGTADNGDVTAIVNNRDNTRTQYFSYDALNRIALANTQAVTGANAWGQAFGYDPWGNLTSAKVTQGSAPSLSLSVNVHNQIRGAPFSYDAAGNLLTDALNTYTWNAEGTMGRISNGQGSVTYTYDGDGRRVEKSNGKLYWYGTEGSVLAESDASGNVTDEYIFFGGTRVARVDGQGNVNYYLSDSLSSARVVTDANGNILDDCDFLPFGNEQCVSSSSGNTYKFTGKERDTESGNDNFGARYYTNNTGRFLSPDPSNLSVDFSIPQTWNRYSYVLNNALNMVDQNGLWPWYIHDRIIDQAFPGMSKQDLQILKSASAHMDSDPGQQSAALAFEHGMRNGLTGQTPSEAEAQADAFIAQNEHNAAKIQADWIAQGHMGMAPAALTAFGNALHTVSDRLSPAHLGYQPWYGQSAWNPSAWWHFLRESNPWNANVSASVQAAQQAFQQTFGFGWDEFDSMQLQFQQQEQQPTEQVCTTVDDQTNCRTY